jgi:SWI/SNF-related matrix-associated actin-dependent regulator of chromatin subfamily A-like protein 1
MAIIRLKSMARKRTKKYDDDLSVQPSAKMITEKVVKRGTTKVNYLIVTFPVIDAELNDALRQAVPTVVKEDSLRDFQPSGTTPEETEPIKLIAYRCAHTTENITALYQFGKHYRFVFDGDIAVRAMSSTEDGKELERMSYAKSNSTIELAKLNGTPYPYQGAGVAYMLQTKKCINADQMGLGKTVQTILATATAKAYPALFIVPGSLRVSPWKKLWRQWAPRRAKTTVIANNKNIKTIHRSFRVKSKIGKWETRHNDVVIVHYDMLLAYMKYLKKIKWRAIVVDESHFIKNRNADRTRAVIELVDTAKPEYVWLLSGTPIKARPEELVTQLRVIDRLEAFGGRGNFMKRYCFRTSIEEDITMDDVDLEVLAKKKYETAIELNKHLRSICYIRREKSEVLPQLPPKTRTTLKFKLPPEARATYLQAETDLVSYLIDKALTDEKFIKSIKKLSKKEKEFAIAEYRAAIEYQGRQAEVLQKIAHCQQIAIAGILEQVKEWTENFLESGEKLVMFFTHKLPLNELADAFPKNHIKIEGGQNRKATDLEKKKYKLEDDATERDVEIAKFQTNPKYTLALCMIGAGGVGHTLTAASNVAFPQLPWGPTDLDQCEDRCHRIGQKDNVTCHYLLAQDTIYEPMAELIEQKRMVVSAVHDGNPLYGMTQGSILKDFMKILTKGKVVLIR